MHLYLKVKIHSLRVDLCYLPYLFSSTLFEANRRFFCTPNFQRTVDLLDTLILVNSIQMISMLLKVMDFINIFIFSSWRDG